MSRQGIQNEIRRKKAEKRKDNRSNGKSSRVPDQTPAESSGNLLRWVFDHVKTMLIWSATLIGIVGGYFIVRPSVIIEPDFLRNAREPFSAHFRVLNSGNFSIYDVTFSCQLSGGIMTNVGVRGLGKEPQLSPGDSATKDCRIVGFAFDGPAGLVYSARFRPSFWPWHIMRSERFTAEQDSSRAFHWTHQPLSK
jgi:hypothetical protein